MQASGFKKMKLRSITGNLYLAAIVFFLYALFAGMIVKKAPFLAANFLNYDMFKSLFGVPVQIVRAVCAVMLAYSAIQILSIFRWETREALRKSEQRCSIITEGAPIVLFVLDKTSVITFIQGKGLELRCIEPAADPAHQHHIQKAQHEDDPASTLHHRTPWILETP